MSKFLSVLMLCALCLGGCVYQHGQDLSDFLAGRKTIETIDAKGQATLIWRRDQIAVRRNGENWIIPGTFTNAYIVSRFSAFGNEYAIAACRDNTALYNRLIIITPSSVHIYKLSDGNSEPFATTSTAGNFYLYQKSGSKYLAWEIVGKDLYGPDTLATPPGTRKKSVKKRKAKKDSSPQPVQQSELPLVNLPELED